MAAGAGPDSDNSGQERTGSSGWKYHKSSEALFKDAAQKYYSSQRAAGSTNSVLNGVPCQPRDIQISYGWYGSDEIAHVIALYLAYDYDTWDERHANSYNYSRYGGNLSAFVQGHCRVFFNRDYKETRRNACVTFIHEYGHLLGRWHNENIDSPMYVGYAWQADAVKSQKLFDRNRKRILSRTICDRSG